MVVLGQRQVPQSVGGDSLESPLIVSSQILCVLAVARVRGRELVFGCVVSGVEEIACF